MTNINYAFGLQRKTSAEQEEKEEETQGGGCGSMVGRELGEGGG